MFTLEQAHLRMSQFQLVDYQCFKIHNTTFRNKPFDYDAPTF